METKGSVTIAYLQEYLRKKDFHPDIEPTYILKLIEEVGELAEALRKNKKPESDADFRGSVEEELWDVMYYLLCIANLHDIDMEKWIRIKEDFNNRRYNPDAVFDPDGTRAGTPSASDSCKVHSDA